MMAARNLNTVYRAACSGSKLSLPTLRCQAYAPSLQLHQKNCVHVAATCNAVTADNKSKCVHIRYIHSTPLYPQKGNVSNATSTADNRSQTLLDKEVKEGEEEEEPIIPTKDEAGKPLSNWARMKFVMKTYSYVVIPVHWVIAPVWFGSFYYAIKLGVDIEPLLKTVGVSDHHIETLKHSKASTALMAYALYKIFTPFRYTLTLGMTEVTIRALRRRGYIKPTPPKEKTYRQSFIDTADAVRDRLQKDK